MPPKWRRVAQRSERTDDTAAICNWMDLRHWRPEKVGGEYRAGDIMLDAALYAAFQEVNPNNEERIYSGSILVPVISP